MRKYDNAAEFHPGNDDVFGRIASRYDFLCDLFSLGIHRLWKRRVAVVIAKQPWSTLLDGATGTGDIILRVLSHEPPVSARIIASDLSREMLAIAKRRLGARSQVRIEQLDAEQMPSVASDSIDAYSISLGLKICDRRRAFGEAIRVLRPGGRLIILESSNIPLKIAHRMYLGYMAVCLPVIGWLATGGDSSAYRYLLAGIQEFPKAEVLADELREAGFKDVAFERLSLGIVAIHTGRKPAHDA